MLAIGTERVVRFWIYYEREVKKSATEQKRVVINEERQRS